MSFVEIIFILYKGYALNMIFWDNYTKLIKNIATMGEKFKKNIRVRFIRLENGILG